MGALRLLFIACALSYNLIPCTVGGSSDSHSEDADVLTSDLLEWLRANGAYINEKLVVRHVVPNDPSSPRGVFASDAMDEGEVLCKIPPQLIVKSTDELMEGLPAEMSYCGAIKAVLEATSGEDITPYGRYLLSQPKGYTAMFWSQAAQNFLMGILRSTRTEELTEYDELPPHGLDETALEFGRNCDGDVDNPLYFQAAMLVAARSDYDVMVPMYDMFNHHNGHYNIKHGHDKYRKASEELGYEILTVTAIQAGEELYNSYNQCNICDEYWDWFGTPYMFLQFGFVEPIPQRWLFDFARVKFDLEWKDGDEESGEVEVNFLVPPSKKGMDLLQEELTRIKSFAELHRNKSYEEYEGISEYEWNSLWEYYDALHDAMSYALESDAALTDSVWSLSDDWWVKDGSTVAADEEEHFVYPTKSENEKGPNDEL
eukprot:CAMPEP_0183737202 /NCGR_PEP_ID=MMETSP0737-20130205/51309_1 /TAXON_ID=385413 /ORGANISM="Thalassiosira miniscula, Strain CCMP1093" /LENGTH=428 /DNA_ID=CAMNT_0025971431 /DNA_START=157 /DNA_END=1443 /DNA_ORIENTATION=-